MRKIMFFLAIIFAATLISCKHKKSGGVSFTSGTEYEKAVYDLQKLPEYNNAVFLSPLQTKEYFEILSNARDKYRVQTVLNKNPEGTWTEQEDGLTLLKSDVTHTVKILFDTSQSIIPVACLDYTIGLTRKNKATGEEKRSENVYTFNLFYLREKRMAFARVNGRVDQGKEYPP